MSTASSVVTMKQPSKMELITITPEKAMELLEMNKANRPLNDRHVRRIADQIRSGKWKYNGDTIKVSDTGDVLDGQHRLWACITSEKPITTIIVYGIHADAFATVDTLRKPRSGSDILALHGLTRHRGNTSAALTWLLRWQRGTIQAWRSPENRIENSDIEEAFEAHPNMVQAVERCRKLRSIIHPGLIGAFYYILANRDQDFAEHFIACLENPSGLSVNNAVFKFRAFMLSDRDHRKDPVFVWALMIKAANAAFANKHISTLSWRNTGQKAEKFPELEVGA